MASADCLVFNVARKIEVGSIQSEVATVRLGVKNEL